MGNILTSILATSNSMRAFGQALNVTQTNVTNVSTPGFVKQTPVFESDTFELARGLPGGVKIGSVLSSRNEYAEQAVRRNQMAAGEAGQRSTDLAQIEPIFTLDSGAGVSNAISKFFQSFNDLSITPNSIPSRQAVLDRAREMANSFNQTAESLQSASGAADHDLRGSVDSINQLLSALQGLNTDVRQNYSLASDPTFDAKVHNTLEQLSELVDFTALPQADGTTEILIGGQTTALIGDHVYGLQVDVTGTSARILDNQGNDITSQISSGRVAGLLTTRNQSIPSYLDRLNLLASTLADRVNTTLAGGIDLNASTPSQNLFFYDAAIGAAQTFGVHALTPSDIAAAAPDAPGGNANSIAMAKMLQTPQIEGYTFVQYFGTIGGTVGRDLAAVKEDVQTREALLAQARNFRSDESGVSLDEEAAKVIEFQRSYQAAARLVSVLNDLTESVLGIIR